MRRGGYPFFGAHTLTAYGVISIQCWAQEVSDLRDFIVICSFFDCGNVSQVLEGLRVGFGARKCRFSSKSDRRSLSDLRFLVFTSLLIFKFCFFPSRF